ncbi:MAG TPA: sugar porter family MFS transporter [Victivallales bacterium]|nr:sugar porter family MFS transporter [Victivallales bacterium]
MEGIIKADKLRGVVIWICIIGALGGLLFGLDQGFINGSLSFIEKTWHLTVPEGESYAGIMLIGAVVGAGVSGWISRLIGRKYTLLVACVFFVVFCLWGSITNSFEILYWTRFCLGLAVGSASFVVPIYLSEIAPTRIRGAMISLYQFFITLGIFLIYFSNAWIGAEYHSWRLMLGVIAVPAAITLILVFFVPKTPRWLMLKKRDDEAKKVLVKTLNSEKEVSNEIKEINESLKLGNKLKSINSLKMFGKSFFMKVLILGVLLMVFQQLTGINTVIYYSTTIFRDAGFSDPAVATILVGLTNMLATILAIAFIDKFGKKPLLYIGLIIMIITLLTIGFMFTQGHDLAAFEQIIMLVSTLVFIIGFELSLGPIAWVMCAEIFPLEGREIGVTITTLTNWVFAFIVVRFSLTIMNAWGGASLFFIFAGFCIVGIFITKYFIPETKGVSLEKLEANLKNGRKLKSIGA